MCVWLFFKCLDHVKGRLGEDFKSGSPKLHAGLKKKEAVPREEPGNEVLGGLLRAPSPLAFSATV